MDGVSYFSPRESLRFDGLPVQAVFGFDAHADRKVFPGSRVGTQPPNMFGVTVEATEAAGALIIQHSAAHSERSLVVQRNGHEYVDVFCYSK